MAERVDENGAAYAGSQLQTQLYVNRRTVTLDGAIREEFPELDGARIQWRSPLEQDGYREYWDQAFLDRVRLDDHGADLKAFWPTGGAHWDALAVVQGKGALRRGVVLVEGKSYPEEFYGSGCQAKPGSESRALIERSLAWTRAQLGVSEDAADAWCGRLYQTANRLAHLTWLRSLGVRAWLVHLLFVDDPHRPTTADAWTRALQEANRELGITGPVEGAGHVLLPAGTREELLRPKFQLTSEDAPVEGPQWMVKYLRDRNEVLLNMAVVDLSDTSRADVRDAITEIGAACLMYVQEHPEASDEALTTQALTTLRLHGPGDLRKPWDPPDADEAGA